MLTWSTLKMEHRVCSTSGGRKKALPFRYQPLSPGPAGTTMALTPYPHPAGLCRVHLYSSPSAPSSRAPPCASLPVAHARASLHMTTLPPPSQWRHLASPLKLSCSTTRSGEFLPSSPPALDRSVLSCDVSASGMGNSNTTFMSGKLPAPASLCKLEITPVHVSGSSAVTAGAGATRVLAGRPFAPLVVGEPCCLAGEPSCQAAMLMSPKVGSLGISTGRPWVRHPHST
mmetsp:Transcript_38829/g.95547  ORF Transcript_38829/g.95547 Transcript_38829/m.95547 type:complete len:229 (+) Transcript_38829:1957-2643(+)